jgi:cobalamin-dependent methionine synthase I
MEGYGLDAVGSAAAEACADSLESEVRAVAAAAGWKITNRLSPGYCGWVTQEQQKLFSLLPGDPCGIRLSSSSLMSPIKSVSGVIGLGPNVRYLDHMCDTCDMTTCYKRKAMPRSA